MTASALPFRLMAVLLFAGLLSSFIYVAGDPKKPDESRFTPVVLAQDLDEPMAFEVLKDGRVLIIERKGGLKLFNPATRSTSLVANIPVNTKYTSAEGVVREAEEGLIGLTVHPEFEKNNWIYLYYAHPTDKEHVLSRYELKNEELVAGSEKVLLRVNTQREVCCHTGGGMVWDAKGNLFLTVGNNTGNALSAHTDERPGRSSWDDQAHAANTNDLRGKILRIHPEDNGSYTIPQGNLFAPGTPKTRPEIYTMGHRNAWRVSIDSKTGFLYWGEVGPDAAEDTEIGPRGYDELNQARKPGNFGWPYFVGPNAAFPYFDYVNNKPLDKKDPEKLLNTSVNNTGLTELPPVAPPFIYYPYAASEKFPLVGSGGRSATGGPIYHRADFSPTAKRPFPAYYEGKWLATDLSRGWIMAITMDQHGDYQSMERFLPSYHPIEPIDMKFGPEGDLYVLEYGSTWFAKSNNSQLVRIEYNAGNRKPLVAVSASKTGGTVPFKTTLSAAGTKDLDGDKLQYLWKVTPKAGGAARIFRTANPVVTLDKPGLYTATLTVTDPRGASNSKSLRLIAGNEPPQVTFKLSGNKSFFFPNQPVSYAVQVKDKEDGSLNTGKINPAHIAVSIDYVSEGFDLAEVKQAHRSVDATTQFAVAKALISNSDCMVCHQVNTRSVGPMFTEIAARYKGDSGAAERLVKKVRQGGSGVWGEVNMPAHPAMPLADAAAIVNYILRIQDKTLSQLPLQGSYSPKIPEGDNGKGYLVLRAAYTDKGGKAVPGQTAETLLKLRNPLVNADEANVVKGAELKIGRNGSGSLVTTANAYVAFRNLDLTGIRQLQVAATALAREGNLGGTIEVRLDSPTGELLNQIEVPVTGIRPRETSTAQAMQDAGGAVKPATPAPAAPRPANPNVPFKVDLKDIPGSHHVYLVFKNDKARALQPLMSFNSIRFSNEKN